MIVRVLRLPQVIEMVGKRRSAIYADVSRGLLPPQVHLGGRLVGWPESEIDAIIRARIAGKTEDDIRNLVRDLVARRKEVA